ncbi:chemotaxis protein CheA [Paenibacillus sp. DMB20]|uniref:chemotaxis protein CheA n=1 Tax=Paenibacillus sp. DMB20 TaxID=1642570 RepID=UPI000627FEDF|nr:chemotaxis protein CheA [Paenibacillus sp. DMB20]KKO54211.1 chemotaxis protein CheA [Paenibacillus sp. DMB20]
MLSEYKEVFMEELDEQLQLMDDEILKLEQEGDKGSAIQSLFRAAHTLKGSSAAMGFESMKLLTHEMEHLLDQVRSGKLDVTASLIDLLFQALDNLKLLKLEIAEGGSQTDISGCVEEIRQFGSRTPLAEAASEPEPETGTIEVPAVPKPKLSMADRLKVAECLEQRLQVNWVLLRISESCVIKGARAYVIQAALAEAGEILYASPDPADLDEYMEGTVELALLFAGMLDAEQLRAFVSGLMDVEAATVEPVRSEETAILATAAPSRTKDSEAATVLFPEPSLEQSPAVRSKSQTIRVSVERMEHLMNLVGELVIDQTRIHQVEQIQRRRFSDESVSELAHISDHLSRVISDLQDSVMKARMLPIEQLFNRFPRMVRDLSRDLGKEIELIVEGKDTELDRTLIEEISDPLIHLIRNAVDHGIETPEIRSASGKPRNGSLVIRAAHEDNQVVIYVRDDGAGIDPAKMRASAVSKGMLTQEEAELLSDREAVGLIFHPGFSTARVVSDVSGRGVGMDIVKSHIEKLNGLIDTDTEPGQGTQFKIKLPLTLAIIEGLLVKLAGQTYIIPMSNIAEIVRIQAEQLITLRGKPVIMLRDQIIPVTWIQDHFQVQGGEHAKKHLSLVIVGSAEKRMALVVDELIGNQEIVIKSLGQYVGKVSGIAGGTILGDGRVALILEISALIQKLSGKQ